MAPTDKNASNPHDIVRRIDNGTAVIVPLANGEPVALIEALDELAPDLTDVTVHQMHALHDHPYLAGTYPGQLSHVSYFLSEVSRPHFRRGTIDFVPANFSEVPLLLDRLPHPKVVFAAGSLPDRHGYVSLGTNADYVARFIGKLPFYVEFNAQMPRTYGNNQLHCSQIAGYVEVDRPLVEIAPKVPSPIDERIGQLVAERVPHGATIQTGIGAIPNAVLRHLSGHRDLGVHTELLSDGAVDLIESGVVTGINKARRRGKVVTTFCLGTRRLYDFLHENAIVDLVGVDWVNDPRVIGSDSCFVSINATTEVDLLGQCASETIGGHYWSGSGGQADFARGAMYSERGRGFIVMHSTAANGTISRITDRLSPGSVVTTNKNTVDHVVTEYGVAELRGRSIDARARALIDIAHPRFRDALTRAAHKLDYL